MPLGAVWAEMWTRVERSAGTETTSEKRERRRITPIEEKESMRWLEGLRQARAVAQEVPNTQCVCVADSEADIFELFAEPRGARPVEWLIRLCHNRTLQRGENAEETTSGRILDAVGNKPVLFTKEINVRGREPTVKCTTRGRNQPRENRAAEVEVRASTVTLRPPPRPDRQLAVVTVNIVWVRELHPPEGDVPVEWLLVTRLK